jgi:hypothetical protein
MILTAYPQIVRYDKTILIGTWPTWAHGAASSRSRHGANESG